MRHESKVLHHRAAASREDEAAAHASSRETAHLHEALAELHRKEAAKMDSARDLLKMAFGQQ
jgi:hypothetical protein